MESIPLRLESLFHRDQQCIAVRGRLNAAADKIVRSFPRRQFSRTHGCWYVPYSDDALSRLAAELKSCQPIEVIVCSQIAATAESKTAGPIELPEGYHECLVRIRYSEATVKTYESQIRKFMEWIRPKSIDDLSDEMINAYQFHLAQTKKVSISTQNTAINAIKFYLEKVHHGERKVYYVERPMREHKLPQVMSQEEVKRLIEVTKNIKHRCILLILYASGIRIGELLNLRWGDFDEERLQLFVRGGKGKKDRITIVSKVALAYTKYYMKEYGPKDRLFEGADGCRYSPRSVNKVIHASATLAGISKRISAHIIRHSFGTHLLEEGTDIRYIQVLMGHESSKTTERYTHVTTRGFSRIKSPLDSLGGDFMPPSTEDNKTE